MKNFGRGKIILIIIIVFFIAGIAWSLSSGDEEVVEQDEQRFLDGNEDGVNEEDPSSSDLQGTDDSQADESVPGVAEQDSPFLGDVLAGSASPLLDFEEHDYKLALASDKLVMLWFYANWCPVCKVEEATAVNPAFNEITHDGVVGFRVNFNDKNTDKLEKQLAKDFGILYQEAKVFLKNGEVVHQAPNPWSKEQYIDTINSLI